jgi:hypothetical protein
MKGGFALALVLLGTIGQGMHCPMRWRVYSYGSPHDAARVPHRDFAHQRQDPHRRSVAN